MNPIADNVFSAEEQATATHVAQLIHTVQPDEDFAMQLRAQLQQEYDANAVRTRRAATQWPRLALAAASLVAVLTIAILSVPSLRAIAQEIVDLITRAESDQISSEGQLIETARHFTSVAEAEADLGFQIYAPTYLPTGILNRRVQHLEVGEIFYFGDIGIVSQYYQLPLYYGLQLQVNQMPTSTYQENRVGASANIQQVTFTFQGELVTGQLVQGGYITRSDFSETRATGVVRTEGEWSNDKGELLLIWQYDESVISLYAPVEDIFALTRDDLIRIAESME